MERLKLQEYRKKRNVTREMLANALGVSRVYIWQIEKGKRRLTYDLAFKIASYLKTKPDVLFYEEMLNNSEQLNTK